MKTALTVVAGVMTGGAFWALRAAMRWGIRQGKDAARFTYERRVAHVCAEKGIDFKDFREVLETDF
jgi:hypothetical protein